VRFLKLHIEDIVRIRHQLVDHILIGDDNFEIVLVFATASPRLTASQTSAVITSNCMMFEDEML